MNLVRATRDRKTTQSSGFDSPEDLCKDLDASPSSFPTPSKANMQRLGSDACIFKGFLDDSDFQRGLRISPYSHEPSEYWRTSQSLVKGRRASVWHSQTETQWREPQAALSPLRQTHRWKSWRVRSEWASQHGGASPGCPRRKSRSANSCCWPRRPSSRLLSHRSQPRTSYWNFLIPRSDGFSHPPSPHPLRALGY